MCVSESIYLLQVQTGESVTRRKFWRKKCRPRGCLSSPLTVQSCVFFSTIKAHYRNPMAGINTHTPVKITDWQRIGLQIALCSSPDVWAMMQNSKINRGDCILEGFSWLRNLVVWESTGTSPLWFIWISSNHWHKAFHFPWVSFKIKKSLQQHLSDMREDKEKKKKKNSQKATHVLI